MTDVQKYNRIVQSPMIVRVRAFDHHKHEGLGKAVAFLEGSYENMAAFISQTVDPYFLCDKAGNPMLFTKNRQYRPVTNWEYYDEKRDLPLGKTTIEGLDALKKDGRWIRDFVDEPVILSFSRYYQIYSAAEEMSIQPWNPVPEDILEKTKSVMLPAGFPVLEDENFTLSAPLADQFYLGR